MERLSANWKWILTTALPIVFAILVFLPGHPRVRAASGTIVDDDIVPVQYGLPNQAKPSPFPAAPSVKRHRQVQPAAAEAVPVAPAPVAIPADPMSPSESRGEQ